MVTGPTVRRATPADAAELTRLRVLMGMSIGWPQPSDEWLASCTVELGRRLERQHEAGHEFVASVVEGVGPAGGDADGRSRLVASGCGWIDRHLPSLRDVTGRNGYIASMSTDEHMRGQGLARLVVEDLLAWFREQGVAHVDLHATTFGEPLYRSVGFVESRSKGMSITLI